MNKILGAIIVTGLAALPAAAATTRDRWVHVRVDGTDGGDGPGRVDIQVPIGMVSAMLPIVRGKHGDHRIVVDGRDVDMEELRGYWSAVRGAKDGEYVTVRDPEANVRIAKSGGVVLVSVDERDGRGRVRMKIPVAIVDAVFARADGIDLGAIGQALERAPLGELITVDDEDSHVRIWIDTAPAPAREDQP